MAWEELAARVTAPRAAWMVAAFPAQAAGDAFTVEIPPERIGDPEPEPSCLPPALDVWLVETNGNEGSLGMLWPTLADLTMSVPSHEEVLDDWLVSWTRAQEVGMGGEFSLPTGCTPQTIASLYVYGIGEDHPAELFRSHADAGTWASFVSGLRPIRCRAPRRRSCRRCGYVAEHRPAALGRRSCSTRHCRGAVGR